jgi:hypothetical protein
LIQSGKVQHVAISDAPSWVVAIANTYAEQKGWHPFVEGILWQIDQWIKILNLCAAL